MTSSRGNERTSRKENALRHFLDLGQVLGGQSFLGWARQPKIPLSPSSSKSMKKPPAERKRPRGHRVFCLARLCAGLPFWARQKVTRINLSEKRIEVLKTLESSAVLIENFSKIRSFLHFFLYKIILKPNLLRSFKFR